MKYTLDVAVPVGFSPAGPDTPVHEAAGQLLAVPGVASVFGVNDFITITRTADGDWDQITAAVRAVVASW
jgi:hypothetical protein